MPTQAALGITSLETVLRKQFSSRSDYLAFPHRLDRSVSGVLLIALTKKSARLLSEQFASRKVKKEYRAWVSGEVSMAEEQLWIDHLRKVEQQARTEVVTENSIGARRAETRVQRLDYREATNRSLLQMFPETGRMHQLRCQTAVRGHPIVGDLLYGGPPLSSQDRPKKSMWSQDRQKRRELESPGKSAPTTGDGSEHAQHHQFDQILLRAHEISFHDPRRGTRITVTASDKQSESV